MLLNEIVSFESKCFFFRKSWTHFCLSPRFPITQMADHCFEPVILIYNYYGEEFL